MKHMFKNPKTGEYTLKEEVGGVDCLNPRPPKYSPEDRMGKYRRMAKKDELKERGLI